MIEPGLSTFALDFALIATLGLVVAALMAQARPAPRIEPWIGLFAWGAAAFVGFSFIGLISSFLVSDFSVYAVTAYSHQDKPLVYRIAGAWGNHEGSMVLWCLILALATALVTRLRSGGDAFVLRASAVMGLISSAFLAFTVFASNPFMRIANPPWEGDGLNPLLQDPALAAHQPMLYVGYVGLAAPFAIALAALWSGTDTRTMARAMRPFVSVAFAALTLGIMLGAYWAYYELGWGGYWFWDPVENASLMPWLVSAALIHSLSASAKRGVLGSWTVMLAILAFLLSVFGTFVTRSGLLTSVHTFALDP